MDRLGRLVEVLRRGEEVDERVGVVLARARVLLEGLEEGLVRLLVLPLLQVRHTQACSGGGEGVRSK